MNISFVEQVQQMWFLWKAVTASKTEDFAKSKSLYNQKQNKDC